MKKHRANVFLALGAAVMLAGCGSGKGEGTQLRMACFPNVTHAQALVMKNQNILDVNNKEYDYQMGVYYMDIIAECEKLGDYVVNVVEASSDVKEKKAS